jgi:molecular chaperone DnaJ
MAQIDYYQILGVTPNESTDVIKKAYRRLAIQCHPDKNPNNPAAQTRFQQLSEAYSVLSDPRKRLEYDRQKQMERSSPAYGTRPQPRKSQSGTIFHRRPKSPHHFYTTPPPKQRSALAVVGKFISGIFNKSSPEPDYQPPTRGADIYQEIELTLQEVAQGGKEAVTVNYKDMCRRCDGSGSQPVKTLRQCRRCKGTGVIVMKNEASLLRQACPNCYGHGNELTDHCLNCHGSGRVAKKRRIFIEMPRGIQDGTQLKILHQGSPGLHGGPSGTLFLTVRIKPHQHFVRKDDDLHCEVEVDFVEVLLGAAIKIPTLDGRIELKLPSGVQPNQLLRIRGRGMPKPNGAGFGDAYIRLKILLPTEISSHQRQLLEQFYSEPEADEGREKWFGGRG